MTPRIAYFVTRFPKTSETFVMDELNALEEMGIEVILHALAAGRGGAVGPEAVAFDRRCRRLSLLSPRLILAQLQWLIRAPAPVTRLWLTVIGRHLNSPRHLVRAVVAVAHAIAHASALQRANVGHVHAHFATHTALAAWVVHRLTGIPYSFTAHADDIFVKPPMLEDKIRDAAFVVTISGFNEAYLRERVLAARETPIEIVPCGVATENFPPAELPPANAPLTLASVARLESKKGHTYLIDACAILVRRGIDVRCRLVGDGVQRAALEQQARELGLEDRVEFHGVGSRDLVREVIGSAHVFALASVVDENGRADGVPVALMEAMAMGRPVVTTQVTGIPELVEDGIGGLLVPPRDATALADAIERVYREDGLAERLASGGRQRVLDNYDLHRNVARLRDLFIEHAGAIRPHAEDPVIRPLGARGEVPQ